MIGSPVANMVEKLHQQLGMSAYSLCCCHQQDRQTLKHVHGHVCRH